MDSLISLAEQRLLLPGDLSAAQLERVFCELMGPAIDAADLYFQHSRSESWVLEDGIVKDGHHAIEQGVGVRAIAGGPIGAAAGLAMQGLLGKGLSHAAGTTYRITGSWDQPKIVRLPDADERKSAVGRGATGG